MTNPSAISVSTALTSAVAELKPRLRGAFVLIAAGGVIYTFGAVVYATKRPDPWPGTFGFHEVFHVSTLVAALCHYLAVWLTVFR